MQQGKRTDYNQQKSPELPGFSVEQIGKLAPDWWTGLSFEDLKEALIAERKKSESFDEFLGRVYGLIEKIEPDTKFEIIVQ